ncbi:MAG TPA: multidrug ABC transporter ATP-binding protein [Rhodospirillaceae bacterium]|nr:multidrug ABC transporter ATP-binding protein [Rhodospirillaceae bacterium]
MTDFAIDVQNLTKRYDHRAVVDGVTIQVPRGKIYGFLGPNGSGKTTTMRMMCGLLTPDEGSGTCLGLDIRTQSEAIKNNVGYMTQRFSYWEDLTVRENLTFVADLYGIENTTQAVQALMEKMDLATRADQRAGSLSGGWKQRLALAGAMLPNPKLLLLDEPTAGVDPKARRDFWDEIHRLADEGITVLVSTHYMDEAERCHAIIYMAYGHIVARGTVQEVIDHAGLTTWTVTGEGLTAWVPTLSRNPAVTAVAPFGSTLHISGPDRAELESALASYRATPNTVWKEAAPSLEDVFIHTMSQVEDNAA